MGVIAFILVSGIVGSRLAEALQKNGVTDIELTRRQWLDCCAKQIELTRTSERMKVTNTVEEVFARMGLRR